MKKILCLGGFLIFLAGQSFAQATKPQKCKSVVRGGKYKWARILPPSDTTDLFFGFVLVNSKKINRDFMIELAKRLKEEYCHAEKFQVVIFDDRKYANTYSLSDYASSNGKIILVRGFYAFDRKTGKDLLEFSTKLGNPTTEVQIDLSALNKKGKLLSQFQKHYGSSLTADSAIPK